MANAEAWLKSVKAKQVDMAKGIKAQMTWLSSSEAKERGAAAKAHAISNSKSVFHALKYPNSKYKLSLIRIAKQLGKYFLKRAMVH